MAYHFSCWYLIYGQSAPDTSHGLKVAAATQAGLLPQKQYEQGMAFDMIPAWGLSQSMFGSPHNVNLRMYKGTPRLEDIHLLLVGERRRTNLCGLCLYVQMELLILSESLELPVPLEPCVKHVPFPFLAHPSSKASHLAQPERGSKAPNSIPSSRSRPSARPASAATTKAQPAETQ